MNWLCCVLIGQHQPGEGLMPPKPLVQVCDPPIRAFSLTSSGLQLTVDDSFTSKLALFYVLSPALICSSLVLIILQENTMLSFSTDQDHAAKRNHALDDVR